MSFRPVILTGATTNNLVSAGQPASVAAVRVGGTANLVGTITIRNGGTVIETIPAASTPGASREFYGAEFSAGLAVQLSNAGDTAIILWGPA